MRFVLAIVAETRDYGNKWRRFGDRDFFYAAFVIGLIFALFYFTATTLLWKTGVSLAMRFFKVEEREFGRLVLLFFIELRIVIVFFFLVPALALHWIARRR